MRHTVLKVASVLVLIIVAAYIAALAYLYLLQRQFVFVPGGSLATPAERSLGAVEVVSIRAKDGTELAGWYTPAAPELPTVLYFQGNAGNISDRSDRFRYVLDSGFGLLAVSYRGYPGSDGFPSEEALFSDAIRAYDWLAERNNCIVIHGESLGTAVATYVAAERPAAALILEAPFTAALDIAAATYPWVPVRLLMRDPFLSREHIKKVEEPVLILHGTDDLVIPVEHAEKLFVLAREPKRLAILEGAGHPDLWDNGLWPIVIEFLKDNGVIASRQAWVRRIPSLAGW
jgi:fermentation-respiration switch protein FrsA (DUF1100 family)